MGSITADLRHGFRLLLKQRAFAATAVLSLAIGIGANTAIFSFVRAILLAPLPVERPDELVTIYTSDFSGPPYGSSSYPDYLSFRDTTALSGLAAFSSFGATVAQADVTRRAAGMLVTGNYFDVLGVHAALGRTFGAADDVTPGGHPIAVLSDRLWRSLGGSAEILGRTINVNGQSITVVGVTSPAFTGTAFDAEADLWVPAMMIGEVLSGSRAIGDRTSRRWALIGRRANGVSVEQAQATFSVLAAQMAEAYPDAWRDVRRQPRRVTVRPATAVDPAIRGAVVGFMSLLMAVVGLVLLIACANVANLLLARAASRRREIAVRLSIGASRLRLVRQLLTESVLLSVVAGLAGVVLAFWIVSAIAGFRPPIDLPVTFDAPIDGRVLAFALLLSVGTGLVFGLVPALQAARAELVPALKTESTLSTRRRRFNIAHLLVVAQVAVSMLLLVGAGLLVRTLQAAQHVEIGFDPANVATMRIDLTSLRLTGEARTALYHELVDRLRSLPDVESASLAASVPLGLAASRRRISPEGYQPQPGDDMEQHYNFVTPDYFETMKIPIVGGRGFSDRDNAAAPGVIIVNEAFGRRFWPGEEPVGKRVRFGEGPWIDVIGVTKDGRYVSVFDETRPYFFLPMWQNSLGGVAIHLRSRSARPASLIAPARVAVHSIGREVPVFDEALLATQIGIGMLPHRLAASWIGGFGGIATLLAVIGLYGVLAHTVSTRHREIGVRLALGAAPASIRSLFVSQGLRVIGLGLAAGVGVSLLVMRLLTSLLYEVSPADPLTLATTGALLCVVALVAVYLPAGRAAGLDPVRVLRQE